MHAHHRNWVLAHVKQRCRERLADELGVGESGVPARRCDTRRAAPTASSPDGPSIDPARRIALTFGHPGHDPCERWRDELLDVELLALDRGPTARDPAVVSVRGRTVSVRPSPRWYASSPNSSEPSSRTNTADGTAALRLPSVTTLGRRDPSPSVIDRRCGE